MTSGTKITIYPFDDLKQGKSFFMTLLGVEPYVELPNYVGFKVGEQEIGLSADGHGNGLTGAVPYWKVDDIGAAHAALLASGATERASIKEVAPGRSICSVDDPEGNVIGLIQTDW